VSSQHLIAERAYHLWNARGRPHGSKEEDWLEAERQLSADAIDSSLQESFPASDPAANHQPDVVPSNAADKWRAAGKNPPG
jgi:hypothetical protein